VNCVFVSDLHGKVARYRKLFALIATEKPRGVFLGGDLLPHGFDTSWQRTARQVDFVADFLVPEFGDLKRRLGSAYPRIFLILGNDDPRIHEEPISRAAGDGLWTYLHGRRSELDDFCVYGYACVPPTPFLLKDWERYDVSRFTDPGCVPPEEGQRTLPVTTREVRLRTIKEDLDNLVADQPLDRSIILFHSPPHQTSLDLADLAGKSVDFTPLDPHVGSIAIRRFIEERQPLLTLHGHIHESPRLTGRWQDRIGETHLYCAAHDGPQLAVVRFDPTHPENATRALV